MTIIEILTFVPTCVLVAVTLYYAIYTHKLASQSKKQTRQMILVSKVAFHRELSEKVYLPIRKWLYPLRDVNSMFSVLDGTAGKGELNIRDNNWHNVKWNLPYLVYQIDRNYEERIKKIDNLLIEYKKIHEQFMDKLNNLITNVVYPSRDSGIVKLYRTPDKLITYICSEELMEKLLTDLKGNNGKIKWYIRADTQMITNDTNPNIKPFDYKEFKSKVDEIEEKIKSDREISSWFELLKDITKEANKLLDQLETEISKDEKVIEAKLFK
ncbi:MAG: hypothetical protein HY607_10270 [Planctomycetes bacterium]|nr:hypothetical protein [Planctomycetota bacterium]MBI4223049.1 hypothetical protein [Planctomycetota bacterium]